MPIEVASTIAELRGDYPLSGDATSQGDDHIRLTKDVLKLQFPGALGNGFDVPITATETDLNNTSGSSANFQTQINDLQDNIDNAVLPRVYPVGAIYTSIDGTNPGTVFGFGIWVAYAAGRVLVGVVGTDTDFDTVEKTGGSKDAIVAAHTHTASSNTTGAHTHTINNGAGFNSNVTNGGVGGTVSKVSAFNTTNSAGNHSHVITVDQAGEDPASKNLQPYITVHFWLRTA